VANKSQLAVQKLQRPGEGALVDVIRSSGPQSHVLQFAANLSLVPVPDRRYPADVVSIVADEHMVRLLFGQRKIAGAGLRSLLVIHMTFDSIHQFLGSLETVEKKTTELLRKLPEGKLAKIDEEPQQTVALAASIIVAGYSGAESCLDFYHTSPFSIQTVQAGGKLALEPVVRITLPTSTFLAMWSSLKQLGPTLPSMAAEVTS